MVAFAADENFDGAVLGGLMARVPELDMVRVQDTELAGAHDPMVLEWAAREGRVLLSHDRATLTAFAHERVDAGQPMPGVIQVRVGMSIGAVIDDLELIALAGRESDLAGRVMFLPL